MVEDLKSQREFSFHVAENGVNSFTYKHPLRKEIKEINTNGRRPQKSKSFHFMQQKVESTVLLRE